jgi:hypothetical protein
VKAGNITDTRGKIPGFDIVPSKGGKTNNTLLKKVKGKKQSSQPKSGVDEGTG